MPRPTHQPVVESYRVTQTCDPKTGIILKEEWCKDGDSGASPSILPPYHRTGGPAFIERYPPEGLPWIEWWYVSGGIKGCHYRRFGRVPLLLKCPAEHKSPTPLLVRVATAGACPL